MVKIYYNYEHSQTVGQVISRNSNFAIHPAQKIIAAGVNQYVSILAIKTGQVQQYIKQPGLSSAVRVLKFSSSRLFAGYEDGRINVWDVSTWELLCTLDQHKSSVSTLSLLEEDECVLVSGGLDGCIYIWDLLSEEHRAIESAHGNAITQVEMISFIYRGKPLNAVLSVAKDGFFKIWSMESLCCLAALSTHATEATSLQYHAGRHLAYVGTNKEDLVLIKVNQTKEPVCEVVGIFKRKSYSRCVELVVDYEKIYLLTSDKKIQIYELLSDQKLKARKKRLLSRIRSKQAEDQKKEKDESVPDEKELNEEIMHVNLLEERSLLQKIFGMVVQSQIIYLNNGSDILIGSQPLTHSNQRTLQLELEYPFLVQRNSFNLKIYSYGHFQPLFSIDRQAEHCALFGKGFLMVVEKEAVSIWDLAKNICILQLQEKWNGCWVAKSKAILWRENEAGFFSVGSDSQGNTKMKQVGTRLYEDKIISAMFTGDFEKYVVNMQNSQLGIFFTDSHKLSLKLYGHKMPVNSFDLSSDGALLATGSIDKDIRLWDMTFGHCQKTIFAHSLPVTALRFIKDTHYLLSGGKDGHVKFWDADTFQLIMDFQDALLEIKSISVTHSGDQIVAGGYDGGFRVWKVTNEQTIASDLAEKQLERAMIEDYAEDKLKSNALKTRYEDLKHGEQIIEALQNSEQPMVVVKIIKAISSSNLRASLSFLHFHHVSRLMSLLSFLIKSRYEEETCWRILEAMNQPSDAGELLRQSWKGVEQTLRVNKELLGVAYRSIRDEKSLL